MPNFVPNSHAVPGAMESDYGVEELKTLPLHKSASPDGDSSGKMKKEGENLRVSCACDTD